MGCKAYITFCQYILFPCMQTTTFSNILNFRKYPAGEICKAETPNQFRADLLSESAIAEVIKHHVFPTAHEAHHAAHPTCGRYLTTQNHSTKVLDLVEEGMTAPQQIKAAMKVPDL